MVLVVVVMCHLIGTHRHNGLGQLLWATNSKRVDTAWFLVLDFQLQLEHVGMVGYLIVVVVVRGLVYRLDCIPMRNGLEKLMWLELVPTRHDNAV
jgi:hypothetical protein